MNMQMKKFYHPRFDDTLWQGRKDALANTYVFQCVERLDLNARSSKKKLEPVLIGFASDEGIARNFGRVGAQSGPYSFRQQLAKMCIPESLTLYDAGNVEHFGHELEAAQTSLAQCVVSILEQDGFPVVIGGGHETAWGHFQGLDAFYAKDDIAILNFDAHFDTRQAPFSTSGTSFRQIQEHLALKNKAFHYYCIGIQPFANPKSLFEDADTHQMKYLLAEDTSTKACAFVADILQKHRHIYLSICLDVFSASIAPGVSAPQALGIMPRDVIQALRMLKMSGQVIGLDIVELSPPHDINDCTAKLASSLLMTFLA